MLNLSNEFMITLKELCQDYDGEHGLYPESAYQGWAIFDHAIDKLPEEQQDYWSKQLENWRENDSKNKME